MVAPESVEAAEARAIDRRERVAWNLVGVTFFVALQLYVAIRHFFELRRAAGAPELPAASVLISNWQSQTNVDLMIQSVALATLLWTNSILGVWREFRMSIKRKRARRRAMAEARARSP